MIARFEERCTSKIKRGKLPVELPLDFFPYTNTEDSGLYILYLE
jgi:hypothetical protein